MAYTSTLKDIIKGLNGNGKKVLVAWGLPGERKPQLVGYEYNISICNNVERMILQLKTNLGEQSGEYIPYPVTDIAEGITRYKELHQYLNGETPETPKNIGHVSDESQVHLLIHRRGIFE
jgi:hypothetical protein